MSEELEKLLADEEKKPQENASADKASQEKDEEIKKKEAHLANINKAIAEANASLRATRSKKPVAPEEEEEIPKIDFSDPGAKAWGKHISSELNPLKDEMAKEKEEIRTFALNTFLQDKPDLAGNADKLKKVMSTYEKLRTASERTVEGVLLDLRKAYAAENADEILKGQERERIERAQGDVIFSSPAISSGSSSFREEREKNPHIDASDAAILAKWGMSPKEWIDMKKAQEKKS